MEISKSGAQSLWIKIQNAELNLKGTTVIYSLQLLAAKLPNWHKS